MKKIIVNASGAKVGGARTIVETFIQWVELNDFNNKYIFIVGFDIKSESENIEIIKLKTNGWFSVFFAVFGILYYSIIYRTNIIFSFMNLNVCLPFFNRITYFHQAKFFEEKNFRFMIYKFFLLIEAKSVFICQNKIIKSNLEKFFDFSVKTKVVDLWPGVKIPRERVEPEWFNDFYDSKNIIALCPYTDVRMSHKGFEEVYKAYDFFKNNNIKVLVTSDKHSYSNNDVFYFCGNCSYSELHFLYSQSNLIIFNSLFETVGLPIFEAQYYGLPVVLSNVDYVRNLRNKFNDLNLIVLESKEVKFNLEKIKNIKIPSNHSCFTGEWDQIQAFF